MRRSWRGIYADHMCGSRREESLARVFRLRSASGRSDGHRPGSAAPARARVVGVA